MKQKCAYGLLVLLTAVVGVVREVEFPRFLLAFEVLYAVVMAVWVHWIAHKLKLSLVLTQKVIQQGDAVGAQVRIQNPTWFPAGEIRAEMTIRDLSGWRSKENCPEKQFSVYAGADRRGTDCWQTDVQPVHCGLIQMEMTNVRVLDYIGLCSARISRPFPSRYVSVLPRVISLENPLALQKSAGREGWQEDVAAKPGEDTQEIFDTRLYQRGDTLRNIHWKLSAKEDDLMVKEFSMPVDRAFYILVDCETEEPTSVSAEQMDQLLEHAAAVAGFCIEQKNPCEMIWYCTANETLHSSRIEKEEDLYQALEELLGICPYRKGTAPQWQSWFGMEFGNEVMRITLEGIVD